MQAPPLPERTFTLTRAKEFLGIQPWTMRRLFKRGKLHLTLLGDGRNFGITESEIVRFQSQKKEEADTTR